VPESMSERLTTDEGEEYCGNLGLRLCDTMDFESLCVGAQYSLATFPSASQGTMFASTCSNSGGKVEQNAGNARLACCSQST
jgi:hypothetical protein